MNKSKLGFVKYINPALRILIGLTFIASGVINLSNISAFKFTLVLLNFFNPGISNILSYFIPLAEAILGTLLVLGIFIRFAAILMNIIVLSFIFVACYAVANNLNLSYGSFGGLWDMKFSWYHLLVLFIIFAINILFIINPGITWSLERIIKNKLSGDNKDSVIKILIIILMIAGVAAVILAFIFNFTYLGRNFKNKTAQEISIGENSSIRKITVDVAYQAYISGKGYVFIDVRSPEEYAQGHIKGAVLIPVAEIPGRIHEIPKDKPIIVYCNGSTCNRSGNAAKILLENGFSEVYDMVGQGILEWQEKGYPYETGN